jgi:hypothetical protein
MTIEEALQQVRSAPNGSVLVAIPPLTWGSDAKYVMPTAEYELPRDVREAGFQTVLDRDDIVKLLGYLGAKKASARTAAEFVIHYSTYDAYPAWFDDLPNRGEA